MEEKRNAFDEFSFAALSALGSLMACNEVCRNQRAVMKINRFRAWLMDLKTQDNPNQVCYLTVDRKERQPNNN